MGSIRTVWLLILRFYTKHKTGLFRSEVLADKTSTGFTLQNLFANDRCFFCRSFCISCHPLLRVDLLCKICHSEALILRRGYKLLFFSFFSPYSVGRLFERAHESLWEWRWVELRNVCDNTMVLLFDCFFYPLILCLSLFVWGISDCGIYVKIIPSLSTHYKQACSKRYPRNHPLNLAFASDGSSLSVS